MAYSVTEPPPNPQNIPEYLSRELRRIEADLRRPSWITPTLVNGWVNYGDPWPPAQYIRTSDGVVRIRGLIKDGTLTQGTRIFLLPEGYRPLYNVITPVLWAVNAPGRVDVTPAGSVFPNTTNFTTDNTWLSLDGITFMAEQ